MGTDNRIAEARAHVVELARLHGSRRAARMIGMSPESFARLYGGLDVHKGTVALALDHKRASNVVRTPSQPPSAKAG